MGYNGTITQTVVTIIANAAAVEIIGPNPSRNYLCIQNVGTNDLNFGFNSTLVAGSGTTLSPGGLGKQGGFFIWDGNSFVPTNQIWAASVAGSTIIILEG